MKILYSILAVALSMGPLCDAGDPQLPMDPAASGRPLKLACVGDSITWGGGPKKGQSYPQQLQQLLGEAWQVANFGHSGRTLLKRGDHPYWSSPQYRKALEFEPDVVIIKLGTNDTKPQNWKFKAEFVADYKELIQSFQKLASKPRVYLCRPCPVIGEGNWGINDAGIREQIGWLDALATDMGLGIIDMNAPLAGKPQLIPDRVHPNKAGYRVMAATAFTALTGKPVPEPAAK